MNVVRCLVISPSDVGNDREAIVEAIELWNAHNGVSRELMIHPVRWETHSSPDYGDTPQGILNRQLVEGCDCAIAIFWTRLGTPTHEYPSGSVEEIDRLSSRGKRVYVYECTRDVPQKTLDSDQFVKLKLYLKSIEGKCLLFRYSSIDELKILLMGHLSSIDFGISHQSARAGAGQNQAPDESSVRVRAQFGLLTGFGSNPPIVLAVDVQNHSSQPFYLSSVFVELDNKHTLQPVRDILNRTLQLEQCVPPGDAAKFLLDFEELIRMAIADSSTLCGVVARDKLDRKFRAGDNDMKVAIGNYNAWLEHHRSE